MAALLCLGACGIGDAAAQQLSVPGQLAITAGEFASALATINGGFFNQNNAFVSSPPRPVPDQIGGGPWVRATGGTFNTTVPGTLSGAVAPTTQPVTTLSSYVGVQAGGDLGRYNIGDSGYSVNFGLTGGQVSIDSTGPSALGTANFDVPFVGGYVAVAGHGFFADALIREDFFNVTARPTTLNITTQATTGAASVGYRYDTVYGFIIPSAALSVTHLEGGSGRTPVINGFPPGTLRIQSIDSELGRLNLTIGRDVVFDRLLLAPFFTASVFNEFAGNARVSFTNDAIGIPAATYNGSIGRVDTYGQFSVGTNAKLADTGMLSFVRADFRTGDRTDGYGVSGGLRYQF